MLTEGFAGETMGFAALVVGFDRATDQHGGGDVGEAGGKVGGEGGEAVALDDDVVEGLSGLLEVVEDELGKFESGCWPGDSFEAGICGLADEGPIDLTMDDGQVESIGQSFDKANVSACFDNKT